MNYPAYPGRHYPNRGPDLVRTYIEHIGINEPNNRETIDRLHHNSPLYGSLLVGRACIILLDNNPKAANRMLGRAQTAMEDLGASTKPSQNNVAAHLYNIATMLVNRDDPDALRTFQIATHNQAAAGLQFQDNIRTPNGRIDAAGANAQNRVLALSNRYAHPWLLTAPALLHWDKGPQRQSNHDAVMIEAGPNTEQAPLAHKLQIKNECLGFCHPNDTVKHEEAEALIAELRNEYAQDIVFISNHCDLQLPAVRRGKRHKIHRLINQEVEADVMYPELRTLDIVTDGLILAATQAQSYRRGDLEVKNMPKYTSATRRARAAARQVAA